MDSRSKIIAISQYKPILGDLEKNIEKHIKNIEKAIEKGASLIIFPELSLTGYLLRDLVYEIAIEKDSPYFDSFKKLSKKMDIVFGFVEKAKDKLIYNSSAYFSKGELVNIYRKIRLPNFGMFEEKRFFKAGDDLVLFKTDFGNTGVLICRDFLFPSLAYSLFYKGADFLISISNSPLRGVEGEEYSSQKMWEDAGKVYSRFFSMYVIYVNRVGFEDGFGFAGGSFVSDPDGKIIFRAPFLEENLYFVNIDLSVRDKARSVYAYYRDEDFEQIKRFINESKNENK